ncbi:hypothetical protein PRIPAC_95685 [Pristionchus pacificus]|uniref:Uncharacterized protein n=1 Tax=Pristionchus pacificus TaxID=54126 RepID=A0A2A6D393_PRIPA|nr:hypothetical protein PRIPAC_95685 [Pristionchus pacificus]|eukprot:PDM84753.1 hypothetical protein PRIPAC_33776 [Pristionchus pacificus]
MADVAAAAPAEGEQQGGAWAAIKGMAMRLFTIYCISNVIKTFTGGFGPAGVANSTAGAPVKGAIPARNMFDLGTNFDLYVYLSPLEKRFDRFDEEQPFWLRKGLTYGDWDSEETHSRVIPTPKSLLLNNSLYLHVFVVREGASPDPKNRAHVKRETMHSAKAMNKYKKKFYKKTANLLTGKSEQSEEDLAKAEVMTHEILNFYHPNMTINLILDHTQWTKGSVPSPLDEAVHFDPAGVQYQPILFLNSYWNLGSDYMPINETVKELNITFTYQPLSMFKFQLYASQQMKNKWSSMMGGDLMQDDGDDDQDALKQALIETNPILLGITVVVSLLHTVFEFLAFKNDIQFWKNKKNLEGLSVRSVVWGVFQSLIVFLYICDNDTNFVIKVSVFIGLLIECWKLPKCMNIELDREDKILGIIPKVKISDKGSYVESDTKEYDKLAFKYLSWALYPLLVGYAIYSLMYVEQKGWYSWVLNMLYGFLLTFGFIMMTPQLFINYKLKSVAHLPWRMLTYKFINTFIDDLFAFVIRMPTMYRIGCFRDDIIFLIYLYQKWAYPVDLSRTNEYGTSGVDPDGSALIAAAQSEETAAIEDKKEEEGTSEEKKTEKKEDQPPAKKKSAKAKKTD